MSELVIFIPSLHGGGLEKAIIRLAVELSKHSVELDFVVATASDSVYSVPGELSYINLNASRIIYSLYPLVKYLKKTKPRVLFSASTPLNIIAIIAKIITGYPKRLVIGERNHLSSTVRHSSKFRDKLLPYLVRILYPFADIVLAVSKSVADDLIAVGRLDKINVQVAYNLFNIDDIIVQASLPTGIDWIDEPEVPILINIGRMVPQKDHDTLLKAFSIVRSLKKCRLIILGEGENRAALQKLTEELQITNDVYMPGFVLNPYAYLSKAKILVHSSIWEGLPGALIEALACGIPIISTNCPGGASEILENGFYGTLVFPQKPTALAESILAQFDKIAETEKLIERARFFSGDRILQEYLDVFGIV